MAFKIKDLMVNVLPTGQRVLCATGASENTGDDRLAYPGMACAGGASEPDTGLLAVHQIPSAQALATLRERLKRQLADVERLHTAAEENLRPQTVEEVDMLTGKLTEALEELKARRAELENKPK